MNTIGFWSSLLECLVHVNDTFTFRRGGHSRWIVLASDPQPSTQIRVHALLTPFMLHLCACLSTHVRLLCMFKSRRARIIWVTLIPIYYQYPTFCLDLIYRSVFCSDCTNFKTCLQRSQMTLDPGTLSPLSHSSCPLTVALGCPITSGMHTDSHTLELNESLSHTRMHINTCCTYWEESAWVSWSTWTNSTKIHDSRHTSAQL